jgi:tRNA-2-methylthio-N6-dimethylallyladenosine synthase
VGRVHCVLVEGPSKKSDAELAGRTDNGKMSVFADVPMPAVYAPAGAPPAGAATVRAVAGDYVAVRVERASTGTLMGTALGRTTLSDFQRIHGRQFTLAPRGAAASAR